MFWDNVTALLGWASVINVVVLVWVFGLLSLFKEPIIAIHSKMFEVPREELLSLYIRFIANYKILTLVFFVSPYFALKIIAT